MERPNALAVQPNHAVAFAQDDLFSFRTICFNLVAEIQETGVTKFEIKKA
jgi:hypothetical protein